MRNLARLALSALVAASLVTSAPTLAVETGRTTIVAAFCTNKESIEVLADVLVRTLALVDAGDTDGAAQLYLEFMLEHDDEARCYDLRYDPVALRQGSAPFQALIIGTAGLPPIPRSGCKETVFWEFFVNGDTGYTWSTERGDNCEA